VLFDTAAMAGLPPISVNQGSNPAATALVVHAPEPSARLLIVNLTELPSVYATAGNPFTIERFAIPAIRRFNETNSGRTVSVPIPMAVVALATPALDRHLNKDLF